MNWEKGKVRMKRCIAEISVIDLRSCPWQFSYGYIIKSLFDIEYRSTFAQIYVWKEVRNKKKESIRERNFAIRERLHTVRVILKFVQCFFFVFSSSLGKLTLLVVLSFFLYIQRIDIYVCTRICMYLIQYSYDYFQLWFFPKSRRTVSKIVRDLI